MKEKIIYENDDIVIIVKEKKQRDTIKIRSEGDRYGIVTSMYARFFDYNSSGQASGNKDFDLNFLCSIEKYANRILEEKGYLLLNQVCGLLGLKQTQEGQHVGWIYGPESKGDRFVNLILNPIYEDDKYQGIMIDFNVDGEILTKLKGESK